MVKRDHSSILFISPFSSSAYCSTDCHGAHLRGTAQAWSAGPTGAGTTGASSPCAGDASQYTTCGASRTPPREKWPGPTSAPDPPPAALLELVVVVLGEPPGPCGKNGSVSVPSPSVPPPPLPPLLAFPVRLARRRRVRVMRASIRRVVRVARLPARNGPAPPPRRIRPPPHRSSWSWWCSASPEGPAGKTAPSASQAPACRPHPLRRCRPTRVPRTTAAPAEAAVSAPAVPRGAATKPRREAPKVRARAGLVGPVLRVARGARSRVRVHHRRRRAARARAHVPVHGRAAHTRVLAARGAGGRRACAPAWGRRGAMSRRGGSGRRGVDGGSVQRGHGISVVAAAGVVGRGEPVGEAVGCAVDGDAAVLIGGEVVRRDGGVVGRGIGAARLAAVVGAGAVDVSGYLEWKFSFNFFGLVELLATLCNFCRKQLDQAKKVEGKLQLQVPRYIYHPRSNNSCKKRRTDASPYDTSISLHDFPTDEYGSVSPVNGAPYRLPYGLATAYYSSSSHYADAVPALNGPAVHADPDDHFPLAVTWHPAFPKLGHMHGGNRHGPQGYRYGPHDHGQGHWHGGGGGDGHRHGNGPYTAPRATAPDRARRRAPPFHMQNWSDETGSSVDFGGFPPGLGSGAVGNGGSRYGSLSGSGSGAGNASRGGSGGGGGGGTLGLGMLTVPFFPQGPGGSPSTTTTSSSGTAGGRSSAEVGPGHSSRGGVRLAPHVVYWLTSPAHVDDAPVVPAPIGPADHACAVPHKCAPWQSVEQYADDENGDMNRMDE
ncbi:hypothetical protein BU17DRAFT_82948 [Hysterangium stoloniferum]|nr:hypothetical protein BU17DRAFT_82948 [Hysterangium stoloniferum]